MTIQQFIEKAVAGGWRNHQAYRHQNDDFVYCASFVLLDPEAWKAVGKVEGWEDCDCIPGHAGSPHMFSCPAYEFHQGGWRERMHRMIDALAEGKTIEQFLEML